MSQVLNQRTVLFLNPADNIAVCLRDFTPGKVINQDGYTIKVLNPIARGHKVATKVIAKN